MEFKGNISYNSNMQTKLIINADDYGLSPEISSSIVELASSGHITSTTVMSNISSDDEMIALTKVKEKISIGVHFNLHTRSLIFTFLKCLFSRKIRREIENEFQKQIDTLQNAGISISHFDSHRHINHLPMIGKIIQKVALKNNIIKSRCFNLKGEAPFKLKLLNAYAKIINRKVFKTPDRLLAILSINGNWNKLVLKCMDTNSKMIYELMTHPSISKEKDCYLERYREYQFLKELKLNDVKLISYNDL